MGYYRKLPKNRRCKLQKKLVITVNYQKYVL